jgi:alginate O-acetyltransferase complex protein AlgI
MNFYSLYFFIFLLIVYLLYFLVNHKRNNIVLLVASYFFYACWDWRFLLLIEITSFTDYFVGINIDKTEDKSKRKQFLCLSMVVNLGLLGFFKYFNFFTQSLVDAFAILGFALNINTLKIILPVGISFYTFKSMTYTIDIYRTKIKPTYKFFDFALFVAFFPQIIAGPINRASRLLPQIINPRVINYELI